MLLSPVPSLGGRKACATWIDWGSPREPVSQTQKSCGYSAISWSLVICQHDGGAHLKEVTNCQRLEIVSYTCSLFSYHVAQIGAKRAGRTWTVFVLAVLITYWKWQNDLSVYTFHRHIHLDDSINIWKAGAMLALICNTQVTQQENPGREPQPSVSSLLEQNMHSECILCLWVFGLWESSFRSYHSLDDNLRDWTVMCCTLTYSSNHFPSTLPLPYYTRLLVILMHATCLRTFAPTICLLYTWCFECLSRDICMAYAFSSFSPLSYVAFSGTSYLN